MWYSGDEKKRLDYSKPIMCINTEGFMPDQEILLPIVNGINKHVAEYQTNGYEVIGFNWFSLKSGKWTSCADFETVEEAIEVRGRNEHCEFYNVELTWRII